MPKEKQYKIVNARVEVLSGGPEPGFLVAELELQPQTAKGKPIFYSLGDFIYQGMRVEFLPPDFL